MIQEPNPVEIQGAETEAQREAIYSLRYDIYVREMGRYGAVADHEKCHLREPDDTTGRLYFASDGKSVVGAMRFTWGGDAPFTDRHIAQYDMTPFLAEVPAEQAIIGERFMVTPEYRGTDLIFRLFCTYLQFVNAHRIQLIFGDSEPHLLNLYQGLGFRTYTRRNVNNPETGYLIPLIMIPEDLDYMRRIESPLTEVLRDFGSDSRVPESVPRLLARDNAVISPYKLPKAAYLQDVRSIIALTNRKTHLFDGLDDEQMRRCMNKSNVIDCRQGDRLIKRGNVAQNMFVILSGTLEVRDRDKLIAVLSGGDIVGEMAFLLESPRSMDVYAATDDVRVLSLSESAIKKMIKEDAQVAAILLHNVAKMLCYKLLV